MMDSHDALGSSKYQHLSHTDRQVQTVSNALGQDENNATNSDIEV